MVWLGGSPGPRGTGSSRWFAHAPSPNSSNLHTASQDVVPLGPDAFCLLLRGGRSEAFAATPEPGADVAPAPEPRKASWSGLLRHRRGAAHCPARH